MRSIFFLVALLAFLPLKVRADLVVGVTGDISGGATSVITDAGGLGIDLTSSFTGGFTGGTATVDYAGFSIGGVSSRFGWDYTPTAGVFHTNDIAYTIDTNGTGTFDAEIGFVKNIGNPSDFLSIETDGTWGTATQWTETRPGLLEFNPAASGGFFSGDPGNGFTPSVTGASYLTFRTGPTILGFAPNSQEFDLNLISTTPTAIPEPSVIPVIVLMGTAWLAYRRKRRG